MEDNSCLSKKDCLIHICDESNEHLKLMSAKNFEKISNCMKLWLTLDGRERDIASDLSNLPGFKENDCIDHEYFYHQKCYIKFTNVTNIERAHKRLEKSKNLKSDASQSETRYSKRPRTELNKSILFPNKCLICKQTQYYVEKYTGKRKPETLVKCQTFAASATLLKCAQNKRDLNIIGEIQDVDCIAKEVKYHKSCYRRYTKVVSYHPSDKVQPMYMEAYSTFCKIVEERIIRNFEILSMKKLQRVFNDNVTANETTKECQISIRQLKRWLQRDYPQLIFVKPKQRNLHELVLYRESADELVIIENGDVNTDSTDTDDGACDVPSACENPFENESSAILYKAALILRNLMAESPSLRCIWPPTANELSKNAVKEVIPVLLFNFLAWCAAGSEEFVVDKFIQVDDKIEGKLLSVAQDLVYLQSRGRKQMPKHLSLAMAVRHISGSSKIIGILNGLGHSISHTAVLEYDTALAEMQLKSTESIPNGIVPNTPVTLVWDNIDFQEETVTGKNTTHYTNGIIVQRETFTATPSDFSLNKLGKKSRKRTIEPPMTLVSNYTIGQRCTNPKIPSVVTTCGEYAEHLQESKLIDDVYTFLKLSRDTKEPLPAWTGYNCLIEKDNVLPLSTIRYLPVLEANPTEFATVNAILEKSIEIADKMSLREIALVFDQAIYAKAQQIRWKEELYKNRIVIRLGEFRILMSFLGLLGKRFKDAGLASIMVESGIVAEGSVNGVLNGKHYNRSIRCHKVMFEALSSLLWTAFFDASSEDGLQVSEHLRYLFQLDILKKDNLPDEFVSLVKRFDKFVADRCKVNATFAFWASYLEMVSLILSFIRATRSADWFLHLAALEEMIPWFFSYDHVNYARYLPIYLLEMLNLSATHPSIYDQLSSGDFVTNRQNIFSGTAMDQTIEQTANRDSKTKGGLIGFSRNSGAVHRWMLSHHMRAQISISCEELANRTLHLDKKKDFSTSHIKMHETSVNNVLSTITSMINPFACYDDVLINISSGVCASEDIQNQLSTAKETGIKLFQEYSKERLHKSSNIDIHSKIPQQKLLTFSDLNKKTPKNEAQKVSLQSSTDILARLIVMGQSTSLDMRYMLTFNLNNYPLAIANIDSSLVKTNKATLIHSIFSLVEKSSTCINLSGTNTLIIDGMAVLQQMQKIASTFKALAFDIFKYIMNLSSTYLCEMVHFVTDTYPLISIKENERKRRSDGSEIVINIKTPLQKTPQQFKKFLANGKNKDLLIQFLYEQWSTYNHQLFANVSLFITHGQECHSISSKNDSLCLKEVPELFSDHVEADTKMLLHANYASKHSTSTIIKSSDTDVFVLTLAMCHSFKGDVFMLMGTSANSTLENITEMSRLLGEEFCSALVGLHVFTGCDTVSAFKGKGKVKPLNMMKSNLNYSKAFQELGHSWDITDRTTLIGTLEEFVCELYGDSATMKVNDLRYKTFKTKFKIDVALPPNFDSLFLHIKRSNYQACIHRRCVLPYIDAPSPEDNGWIISDDEIKIAWSTIPSVPECLMKHISCSCLKTACTTKQCSCKASNVECTDICSCVNCKNTDCKIEDLSEEIDYVDISDEETEND